MRTQCSVDGCERNVHAKGMCSKHWSRVRVYGDPHKMAKPARGTTPEDAEAWRWRSFWEGVTIDANGCWIPSVKPGVQGYVQIRIRGKGKRKAHTVVWEWLVGPKPEGGLVPDHLCRNHACCNPQHIEWVTQQENVLRGEGEAAKCARKTHCKRGHPLIEPNLYMDVKGGRQCRTCIHLRRAAYAKGEVLPR